MIGSVSVASLNLMEWMVQNSVSTEDVTLEPAAGRPGWFLNPVLDVKIAHSVSSFTQLENTSRPEMPGLNDLSLF